MLACGIDIERPERLRRLVAQNRLPLDIFTDQERRSLDAGADIGACFTAKEAMLKALGVGWFNSDIGPHDVELRTNLDGRPAEVILRGAARERMRYRGYTAIQHDTHHLDDHIVSIVILRGCAAIPVKSRLISLDRINGSVYELDAQYQAGIWGKENTIRFSARRAGHVTALDAIHSVLHDLGTVATVPGDIEHDSLGCPRWSGQKNLNKERSAHLAFSISHSRRYACSFAIAASYHQGGGRGNEF